MENLQQSHTQTHASTHTHARMHARAHAHTRTHTRTLSPSTDWPSFPSPIQWPENWRQWQSHSQKSWTLRRQSSHPRPLLSVEHTHRHTERVMINHCIIHTTIHGDRSIRIYWTRDMCVWKPESLWSPIHTKCKPCPKEQRVKIYGVSIGLRLQFVYEPKGRVSGCRHYSPEVSLRLRRQGRPPVRYQHQSLPCSCCPRSAGSRSGLSPAHTITHSILTIATYVRYDPTFSW